MSGARSFPSPETVAGFEPYVVTPAEVPDLRLRLVDHYVHQLSGHHHEWSAALRADTDELVACLDRAELFHIDATFCDLAAAAHDSMPAHVLSPFDPPSPDGLAFIARPSASSNPRHLGDVAGWFWHSSSEGVRVGTICDRRGDMRWASRATAANAYWANASIRVAWGTSCDSCPQDDGGQLLWASNLVVFWNLLRQKGLASDSELIPPRAVRRREERSGREASSVRVISLPSRGGSSPSAASETDREWQHRWIVRGHWRQQWYPSIQDHRPVWIAPHLKGPEDAPLLGGQKVYAVKAPPQEAS